MKVKELNREVTLGKGSGDKTNDLRREILHLQKDLLQEKTKVTALSEELENPMNVHRWRKLEGSDPATFELIQKIQTLQRRLISKTEEVVEKGLVIQEKEKLYQELKQILSRQPGPEVAEQLTVYQHSLRNKSRQLKAMASELNMYQAQVNEYKYEIERVTRELQDLKRKYYQQKRKDQLMQELELENEHGGNALPSQSFAGASLSSTSGSGPMSAPGKAALMSKTAPQALQNDQILAAKSARTRFTGGGFAIK
jgi:predicted RNase H-like nuclease (RuvC/YqgF family)